MENRVRFAVFLSSYVLTSAFLGGSIRASAASSNIYIAQTAAGAANGTDCADAYAVIFFNTASNWGTGSTQIGPGTTVHLCGTFTFPGGTSGALIVQGSGASGTPVRIQFEAGAKAVAPYWGSNGFINIGSRGFIQIDGSPTSMPCGYVNGQDVACNGTIQASANGAALANHVGNGHAINLNGSHDIEVRNLSCQNLFVPQKNNTNNEGTNGPNNTACVWWLASSGGGNINIHNIQVNNSWQGVLMAYEGSNAGMHVDNSWMTGIDVAAQIGAGNSNAAITSGSFHGNDVSNMDGWDNTDNRNHHEFIHLYTQQSGATISNFTIDGNYFHGTLGANMTAEIYVECDGGSSCTAPTSIEVNEFNNIMVNEDPNADISTGAGGNTMTECEGSICSIYNNTYYSIAPMSSLNCAMHLEAGAIITVKNNIFDGMNCAISNGGGTVTANTNLGFGLALACGTACSVNTDPLLNLSSAPKYQLASASSGAYQSGANLTTGGVAGLNVDQLGVARPSIGAWDMGAFQYAGGISPQPPSAPAITSAATASGVAGSAFSYQITATNNPTSYSATGLPAGLSANTLTGLISGTPTATGTTSVTISATNAGGTGSATLTVTVNAAPVITPAITSAATASGVAGSAFSYQITATNNPTSYSATGLPAGLSANTLTGLISGTPTATGTTSVTISATNAGGTGSATLTVTVNAPADTTPPTVPTGFNAISVGETSLSFAWSASTDIDSAVVGYYVYRNGAQIGNVMIASFSDSGLAPSTTYSYSVAAYDPSGNTSAASAFFTLTTQVASTTSGGAATSGGTTSSGTSSGATPSGTGAGGNDGSSGAVSSGGGGGGGGSVGGGSGGGGGGGGGSYVPSATPTPSSPASTPQSLLASLLVELEALIAQLNHLIVQGFARDLAVGSIGTDVQNLQMFLNDSNYPVATTGNGSIGKETTYFGQRTAQALSRWQKANGLPATGALDATTTQYMRSKYGK